MVILTDISKVNLFAYWEARVWTYGISVIQVLLEKNLTDFISTGKFKFKSPHKKICSIFYEKMRIRWHQCMKLLHHWTWQALTTTVQMILVAQLQAAYRNLVNYWSESHFAAGFWASDERFLITQIGSSSILVISKTLCFSPTEITNQNTVIILLAEVCLMYFFFTINHF